MITFRIPEPCPFDCVVYTRHNKLKRKTQFHRYRLLSFSCTVLVNRKKLLEIVEVLAQANVSLRVIDYKNYQHQIPYKYFSENYMRLEKSAKKIVAFCSSLLWGFCLQIFNKLQFKIIIVYLCFRTLHQCRVDRKLFMKA